ncbi:hypothetical protein HYS94_03290 [Candidatus Daviesbacteria bacterium]|nr:hypothetical protein [Candidatus Daviesbacteria bacterium]
MENLGVLSALGAALAWGSYFVPFKKSKSHKLILFQFVMTIGILISGIILSIMMGFPLSFNIFGVLTGVIWAIANTISLSAVLNLGISRAAPILASLVILSSFLWGTVVFNELSTGMKAGFSGIGLIILGVVLVSSTGNAQSQNVRKGLLAAIVAGLMFGSQFVPVKIGQIEARDFFFSMSLGIFLTGLVTFLIKRIKLEKEALKESLLSGIIWNIGNLLGVMAISLIGLAKGLPLTQVAVLVAVVWGLVYFREITQKKQKIQVMIGAIILLLGVVILSSA